ncbi:TraR/DksA C4-type zinc finger protein [Conyzicola nivalis]|uniref:DnaK suppressor protein n=1 Tax=Conyzicola nivalis TaxID=1477021 RepID=A0A916SPM0_9MICO|nr:DnaK suppressor protein [Conyzicola nivalis]
MLTAEQQKSMRNMLAADRDSTESLVAQLAADLDSFTGSRTDSATDDEHDPEGPTLAFERSQSAAILGQTREHLEQIEHAIVRLDEGDFGTCATCGNTIPFARLEARPYSTQCVACASKARR